MMDNPIIVIVLVFVSVLPLVLAGYAVYYLDRLSKDLAHVRSLLTAFMEQRVAGTLAEHKLATAVEQAKKAPTPAGAAR